MLLLLLLLQNFTLHKELFFFISWHPVSSAPKTGVDITPLPLIVSSLYWSSQDHQVTLDRRHSWLSSLHHKLFITAVFQFMLCWIRSVLHSSSGILQGTMRSDMTYLLDPGRDFICCRSMLWHCLIDRLPSPAILNLLSLVTDWHTHKCVLYKISHFTGALQHFAKYICLRSLSVRLLHFYYWKQVHTANKGSPVSFACCVMLI